MPIADNKDLILCMSFHCSDVQWAKGRLKTPTDWFKQIMFSFKNLCLTLWMCISVSHQNRNICQDLVELPIKSLYILLLFYSTNKHPIPLGLCGMLGLVSIWCAFIGYSTELTKWKAHVHPGTHIIASMIHWGLNKIAGISQTNFLNANVVFYS